MLSGKTIIVTGAASGIGAESARVLASQGAKIIAMDQKKPCATVYKFIHIDLLDLNSIEDAVSSLEEPINALCNIAGVPPTVGEETTLRVNFIGLKTFTDLVVPKLEDGAPIVNMASLAGFDWEKNLPEIQECIGLSISDDIADFCTRNEIIGARAYFFSKEVLRVWTMQKSLALSARNIRMNCISPGPVETPILKDFVLSLGKRAEDDLKKNRAGRVEEIAPVVAFLCSDASRWINGANIPVDGGAMAAMLAETYQF